MPAQLAQLAGRPPGRYCRLPYCREQGGGINQAGRAGVALEQHGLGRSQEAHPISAATAGGGRSRRGCLGAACASF